MSGLLAPLALIGLLALPVIVAFYMLRLRRRDVPVGSTFLWQQLIRDVEANAPWQRLRFSWLLVLQLLIAALVVFAATRPFAVARSDLAANVVLIVDTSASMGSVEADGPRIEAAREAARRVVERLPEGGRITVVTADDSAHVLASETTDRGTALAALDAIAATQVPGDLTDAFALASALAARDADSTVVVVTDATADRLPPVGIGAPVLVERVGQTDANQAISALSVVRRSGGAQLDLFVAVTNHAGNEVTRRLEIYADGELVDARDLTIPAAQRSEALVATVPPAAEVVEARLDGVDALAVDDRALAIVPSAALVRTLLVSDGSAYLENALALLPRLELYAVTPAGYDEAVAAAAAADTPYGLLVLDGFVPDVPPAIPTLYVGPTDDGPFGTVGEQVEAPAIAPTDPADPLLRYIDLTTVHIGRAPDIELADGMRAAVTTAGGRPLVAVGSRDGRAIGLIGFDIGESDLPLQVAFPLLMSNLADALVPIGDGILPPSIRLGEALALDVDPELAGIDLVDTPTGGSAATLELASVGGRVTLPGAEAVGIREVWSPETEDTPAARLGRTAVNLFSADESDVAPGDPMRIRDMGSLDPGSAPPDNEARSEWFWPLVLGALLLLAVEWVLFHRPTRRSIGRALGRRPPVAEPRVAGGRAR
ncbi:MAG TPA: BatA and WFA domain-containing protein [Candidatus Limnocylindria bacterium]|nr:BatA and WFA domain-containing protein [Candidatus Limnocylindria bacterium]